MSTYEVLFNGTPHAPWGKYLEPANRANAERFTPRPAPVVTRDDERGRPAHAVDILGVLNVAKQPITKTEIMQRTGSSRERVWAELQRLIAAGQVTRTVVNQRGGLAVYSVIK